MNRQLGGTAVACALACLLILSPSVTVRLGAGGQTLVLNLDGVYWDNTARELRVGNRETLAVPGIDASGTGDFIVRRQDDHAKIRIARYGTVGQAWLAMDAARGTVANPTALQAGDSFGSWVGVGFPGGTAGFAHGPEIRMLATENWTTTAHGAEIVFYSVPNGSTTQTSVLRLTNGQAQLPGLSGSASTHVCVDASGNLFRCP